ncbi:T-complex protein 11-domain-containing protein [Xylariales sp. PMI_506]|nr:T-complex protein 11-domain-containing protein [Xylariales sp. PMI_506]
MGDQGAGGIESSGRGPTTRRLSEPNPNTQQDQIQQQAPQVETPSSETEKQVTYPQNDYPRNLVTSTPSDEATPVLSRNPSTSSNASGSWSKLGRASSKDADRATNSRSRSSQEHSSRSSQSSRPLEPPVTKATLSELDVNKIIHNPKLRHDINFDPELHFRPNLDGEKGRRKQDKANQFWTTLRDQLQLFVTKPEEFLRQYGQGQDWCLPLLLRSVKEIIQTLVPARDRVYLDEGLNVDLIMQQFLRGIADLEKLASWLSGVLKSHCAPMRDDWVDEMYNQLTNGNRTNNMDELVQGMRSLLSVLEAMKLDVANHQIRCLRPILIEDTVHFEKRFFDKKIQTGKLNPQPAQQWYNMATHEFEPSDSSRAAFGEMAVFFSALCRLVLPSNPDPFPNTFLFDEERLFKLRTDMLDSINLEICMRLHEKWEKHSRRLSSSNLQALFPATFSDGSSFLGSNLDDDTDSVPSRPASFIGSSAGSANSSPRSSLIFSNVQLPTQADSRAKSRNLFSSLQALLQTSPPTSKPLPKWKNMKDSLALQIFRYTDLPQEYLLHIEDDLELHLNNVSASRIFEDVEQHFHGRLMAELQRRVKEFRPLTGVGLFSGATGSRTQGSSRTWESLRERSSDRDFGHAASLGRDDDGIDEMATRLAHLGILHWRVWSQLVYNTDAPDVEMTMDSA